MANNIAERGRTVEATSGRLLAALGGASTADGSTVAPVSGVFALVPGVALVGTAQTRVRLAHRLLDVDTAGSL